jgi:hypothetical protein
VEVLKAYSHTPELLYDLRCVWEIVSEPDGQKAVAAAASEGEPVVDGRNAKPWSLRDRLTAVEIDSLLGSFISWQSGAAVGLTFHEGVLLTYQT